MNGVLSGFLPIVFLAAVGWTAARFRVLGDNAERVLSGFVFNLAMPAALFTTLQRTPLPHGVGTALAAFAVGTVLMYLTGALMSRWVFHRGLADQAIGGMAAGHVNAANLGIPVASQLLGNASFLAPVLLLQTLVVTPVLLAVIEAGNAAERDAAGGDGGGRWARVRGRLLLPVRNPIVLGTGVGLLVSEAGWGVPAQVLKPFQLLGGAAVPAALVALGMSLQGRFRGRAAAAADEDGAAGGGRAAEPATRAELLTAVGLKVLGQPLVTYLTARWIFRLPDAELAAVMVCAALPTAQNAYLYARHYGLRTSLARDAVAASTLCALATLSLLTLWLHGAPPGGGAR